MLLALVDFDPNFWGNSGIAPEKSQFSPIFWGYPRFPQNYTRFLELPQIYPPQKNYPKTKVFWGKKNITPNFWDLPQKFGVIPELPQISGIYTKFLGWFLFFSEPRVIPAFLNFEKCNFQILIL